MYIRGWLTCVEFMLADMLDANFRRQLLMDGNYGSLVFIATQSDLFQRSEVCCRKYI
jgi:hypothetical protein